jgi:hypothetical protein
MRHHTSPGFQGKAENIKQKKQQVTTSETAEVLHSISINKSQQIQHHNGKSITPVFWVLRVSSSLLPWLQKKMARNQKFPLKLEF